MRTRFTIILNPHDQQKISVSLPPFSVRDCRRLVLELAQRKTPDLELRSLLFVLTLTVITPSTHEPNDTRIRDSRSISNC
jgi:hypothetical protein